MTREEIRATVTGLEDISKGIVSGRPDMVARDALTLLRDLAVGFDDTLFATVADVFADRDSERKSVSHAR